MVFTRLEHNDFMLRESHVKTDTTFFEEFLEFESHGQERHEVFLIPKSVKKPTVFFSCARDGFFTADS
jgi:hypothetical protein